MNGVSDETWKSLDTDQKIDVLHDYMRDLCKQVSTKRTILIGVIGGAAALMVCKLPVAASLLAAVF